MFAAFSRISVARLMVGGMLAVLAGCGREGASRKGTTETPVPAVHQHVAPHGGTAVELGHEEFHLELVLDVAAGKLTGYVLDGELEQFIRISSPTIRLLARLNGAEVELELKAMGNLATGEKAGDTSQFEGTADWLRSTPRFDARIPEVTIRGKTYRDVSFNFPKGNE